MKLFEVDEDGYNLVTDHDFRGMDFVWYSSPVNHYDISRSYARIASFDQLEYYAEVFFFLNPDTDKDMLSGIFQWIGNRENGKSIRTYGKRRIFDMIDKVYYEKSTPWCRRPRKVVFNPNKIISSEEKISISSHLTTKGLSYTEFDLIRSISSLYASNRIITHSSLSLDMDCSEKTVQRLITDKIKKTITENNQHIRRESKIADCIEWIDVLSSEGDKIRMRSLKDITKIRDYSIIKEAILRYENQT